jgi:hypothetical protein
MIRGAFRRRDRSAVDDQSELACGPEKPRCANWRAPDNRIAGFGQRDAHEPLSHGLGRMHSEYGTVPETREKFTAVWLPNSDFAALRRDAGR